MNGLFTDHGLDVEILDPSGGPDNIARVASGGSDFALTSVQHYLSARAAHGELAARFVAIIVQRSPIAALVPAGSPLREPADLAECKVGGDPTSPHLLEFLASLDWRGIPRPTVVELARDEARKALGRGEIDAIVELVDALPRRRRQSSVYLRPIRVGRDDVYASGLVAADRLPDELVWQVRQAIVAALENQRCEPTAGVEAIADRYASDYADDAPEGWKLLEPFVFGDAPAGSMDAPTWATTLEFLCRARGFPVPEPETVYRPQFLGAPAYS